MGDSDQDERPSYWEPLLASILVSLLVGVSGLYILVKNTRAPLKSHYMSPFNHFFFALFFSGSLVRCFYWVMYAWPGEPSKEHVSLTIPIGLRVFLITYPQVNVLVCSFLLNYPWLYDYILIQNGRQINLVLRQQIKMFVVAAMVFTCLMYMVYLFSFPIDSDEPDKNNRLYGLYETLFIFFLISVFMVSCQAYTSSRRLQPLDQNYWKLVRV